MAKHNIRVTGQDINLGIRGSFCNCPVALAIRRELGRVALVGLNYITLERPWQNPGQQIATPRQAQKLISDFDMGAPVEPMEFELEVPECT